MIEILTHNLDSWLIQLNKKIETCVPKERVLTIKTFGKIKSVHISTNRYSNIKMKLYKMVKNTLSDTF